MGILARAFSQKGVTVADLPAEILQLGQSKSGQSVTIANALKVSTVCACVRRIAEGMAQVSLKLYIEDDQDNKRAAREHPLYDVLHRMPNDVSTSFGFRETLVMHAALCGTGYAFINRSMGEVVELINIEPGAVTVKKSDRMGVPPRYQITGINGAQREFPAESILRITGPSWDGIIGMEPLKLAREAVGLAMATEETHASLHRNGVAPSGLYSVDATLNPQQYKDLKKWIEDNYAGPSNRSSAMILDRGAKFVPLSQTGVDAQHLETRRHQIEEICRFFQIMPIMIGYSDKASTYASAEQMFLAHVVHCLAPWAERIEQAMECQLLTREERRAGYYIKHNLTSLLRGATKDRGEYFSRALGAGGAPAWMTQDEVRALEDLNPMGGPASQLPIATHVGTNTGTNTGGTNNA